MSLYILQVDQLYSCILSRSVGSRQVRPQEEYQSVEFRPIDTPANLSQYKIFHDFMHMRARYKPGTSGRSMQVEQRKKSTCPNEGVSADPALPACQNPSTH